ncbi:hypothetical protein [Agromyces sp. CCNWLW203]|uniref:hypothetical protein n=1 Tax=Agromyces sp. CCNWLW203 TaxID=3112842 RepID=UPI002F9669CC
MPSVDPLTTVTEIVVRPEHLDLLDAAGVIVMTLSYDADAPTLVSQLSTVLDAEPAQSESAGGLESRPSTQYVWDGLRVTDDDDSTELGGPIEMNVRVSFTSPVVADGVNVRTVNGFRPGDDVEALAAASGEPWYGNGHDQVRVETGEPIGEQQQGIDYENAYSVTVNTWEVDGTTSWVSAPWNFGVGHV